MATTTIPTVCENCTLPREGWRSCHVRAAGECTLLPDPSVTPLHTSWLITVDHLSERYGDDSEAGTIGPRCASLDEQAIRNHPDRKRFKLYDDDGELYYSGMIVIGEDDDWGEHEFRPLFDFGAPNAGCTEIRYRNAETGKWETL